MPRPHPRQLLSGSPPSDNARRLPTPGDLWLRGTLSETKWPCPLPDPARSPLSALFQPFPLLYPRDPLLSSSSLPPRPISRRLGRSQAALRSISMAPLDANLCPPVLPLLMLILLLPRMPAPTNESPLVCLRAFTMPRIHVLHRSLTDPPQWLPHWHLQRGARRLVWRPR